MNRETNLSHTNLDEAILAGADLSQATLSAVESNQTRLTNSGVTGSRTISNS